VVMPDRFGDDVLDRLRDAAVARACHGHMLPGLYLSSLSNACAAGKDGAAAVSKLSPSHDAGGILACNSNSVRPCDT
jgi:hypothetical protein